MEPDAVDQLHQAFQQRNVETIRSLAEHVSIDTRNSDGLTVLMLAAVEGDGELVQWVLDAGAKANVGSHTPVESPGADAEEGELIGTAALTAVLRSFASTRRRDQEQAYLGQTALLFAAESGSLETVEALLQAGANPNVADVDGGLPLYAAAATGDAAVVDCLLAAHAATGLDPGDGALEIAAALGHVDVARLLIESGVHVESTAGLGTGMTPLYRAAASGQAAIVELLLQAGASATSQGFGSSALLAAIAQGHESVVRILLASQEGEQRLAPRSLLHLAVENGQAGIVALLAQAGTDVNATDLGNRTPLHIAIDNRQVDVVAALVEAGGNVNLVPQPQHGQEHFMAGDSGRTPLILAASQGLTEIVDILVKAGADLNRRIDTLALVGAMTPMTLDDEGFTALMLAGRDDHSEVTQILVEAGADLEIRNSDEETALAIALRAGERNTANIIRRAGAKTANTGPARLIGALKRGDAVTVSSALASGVDPDSTDPRADGGWHPALILAGTLGDAQSVYALLGGGADPDGRSEGGEPPWGMTALMAAAKGGHLEAVQALLKGGTDPELHERDSTGAGRTAFMIAAAHGQDRVLRGFKRMYDKIDYRSADGMTALTCAASGGHSEAVERLLEWGAEIVDDRQSALAAAAREGHLEILKIFLAAGAEVDAHASDGVTALMAAAGAGQLEAAEALLAAGADPKATDIAGRTALAYAAASEQSALVRRLESGQG